MPLPVPPGLLGDVVSVDGVPESAGGVDGLFIVSPAPPGTPGDVVSVGGVPESAGGVEGLFMVSPAPPGTPGDVVSVGGVPESVDGVDGLFMVSPAPPGTPGDVVSVGGTSVAPGSGAEGFGDGSVSGVVVVPADGVVKLVPPGQRELSGKRSHRILNPSGESSISGVFVSVPDCAKATLPVTANTNAVQMMVKYFAFTPINLN